MKSAHARSTDANQASSDLMYREHILDHYKNPRNYGRASPADLCCRENNPLCGDDIEISATIEGKDTKKLTELKFQGHGCAISQAAASLMTEELQGKTLANVERFSREDMLKLLGIPISAMRMKCALLARHVLLKGILMHQDKK